MRDNTVEIDRSMEPHGLKFSEWFNASVAFIDRHLSEGRGNKVAIKTHDEEWTYSALNDAVNRFGNHLLKIGILPKERLMMVMNDSPQFIALFYGAIKAGIIPVPVNTMLRPDDYKYLITDSACSCLVYNKQFAPIIQPVLQDIAKTPNNILVIEDLALKITGEDTKLDVAKTKHLDDCFWLYSCLLYTSDAADE